MTRKRLSSRRVVLAACVAAGGLSACGDSAPQSADLVAGKKAFAQKCSSCHALERAGAKGTQGPNLDEAFRQALSDGLGRGMVRGAVHSQILHPAAVPAKSPAYMPANLVKGKLAEDVAAYVASAVSLPGKDEGLLAVAGGTPPVPADAPPGLKLFVAGKDDAQACGSCHALDAARTQATTGPNLDTILKGMSAKEIEKAIADPSAELTPGFSDVMPKDYGEALTDKELQELVDYLAEQAGD